MTTPYCPGWLYVEAIPYKFVSRVLHASLCHDVILTVKRIPGRDYVCVCGCQWMYRPLFRKGSPMVDGHTGEWMIERMMGNAPQSLPHPANAAEYIRREKGKGMNKKGDARSDPPSRTARLACIGETDCQINGFAG